MLRCSALKTHNNFPHTYGSNSQETVLLSFENDSYWAPAQQRRSWQLFIERVESTSTQLLHPQDNVECSLNTRFYVMKNTVPAGSQFPGPVAEAAPGPHSLQQPVVVQVVTQQGQRTCKLSLHRVWKFLKITSSVSFSFLTIVHFFHSHIETYETHVHMVRSAVDAYCTASLLIRTLKALRKIHATSGRQRPCVAVCRSCWAAAA